MVNRQGSSEYRIAEQFGPTMKCVCGEINTRHCPIHGQGEVVTPLKPMEPGKLWCIFEQRGTYEFLCAPETGADFLEHGMVVDGKRLPVRKIDEYASVNAWHIEVVDPDMNKEFLAA